MPRYQDSFFNDLWVHYPPSFELNSEKLRKVERSLNCLCEVVESSGDEIIQGELLFSGLERVLDSGVRAHEISRCHRFMALLTSFGMRVMSKKRGSDGFYLGIFCEIYLPKSWSELKVVKILRGLFSSLRQKLLTIPMHIKEKLLLRLKAEDQELFYRFFPRACA